MIYFIKHTEYVKIGYTSDILSRLSGLQVSCPIKLSLLGLIDGTIEDEQDLHKKFIQLKTSGEWFKYTSEMEDFIQSLDRNLMWKYGFETHISSPIGVIKSCRLEKNLSMEELGERLGITKQAVLDMEKREIQGKISVANMVKALDVMGYRYEHRAIVYIL